MSVLKNVFGLLSWRLGEREDQLTDTNVAGRYIKVRKAMILTV